MCQTVLRVEWVLIIIVIVVVIVIVIDIVIVAADEETVGTVLAGLGINLLLNRQLNDDNDDDAIVSTANYRIPCLSFYHIRMHVESLQSSLLKSNLLARLKYTTSHPTHSAL